MGVISTKQLLVNTFGGKCQICGYNTCLAALAFHHRNPKEKDFQISDFKKKNADNYVLYRELEKCILVCSNCHIEIHQGMHNEKVEDIPEVCLEELI